MTLQVLHNSGGVLGLAKPAGLPTQAPPGIPSVELLVRQQLFGEGLATDQAAGQRRHPGGFLGVPHRLDRAVSGVLLLATTPRAARQLSRQFERRLIQKIYLAVVENSATVQVATDASFQWRDTLRKVPDEPRSEVLAAGSDGGREALTSGRLLATGAGMSLLKLEPHTGRMHQLRIQAAARAMPVLGDRLYGGPRLDVETGTDSDGHDPREEPIALHAWRITFTDSETGLATEVVCPPPAGPPWDAFAAVL